MKGLIERLRAPIGGTMADGIHLPLYESMRLEAANEIERLRAALEAPRGTQSCPICGGDTPHRHDSVAEVYEHLERQAMRFGHKVKVVPIPDDAYDIREPGMTLAIQLGDVHSLHRCASIINHAFDKAIREAAPANETPNEP